jgi:hypothetical protein
MRMGGVSCLRRRSADGDHTHALVAQQSQSFPDNLVALLGKIRAWNCSGPEGRMRRPLLGFSTEQGPLAILGWPIDFATRIWRLLGERWSTMQRDPR